MSIFIFLLEPPDLVTHSSPLLTAMLAMLMMLLLLMMMLTAIDAIAGVDAQDAAGDDQDAC